METKVADGRLALCGLEAVLERLKVPIFIVRRDGTVRYASARGRMQLAADPVGLKRELRAVVAGEPGAGGWRATPLDVEGWYVVDAAEPDVIHDPVDRARARFGLTPRQGEVVELLLGGATNDTIATVLKIAPRTVEVHLRAIYDRAGVENRTSLVSLVLTAA
jgi:DNA-binding CsgD family transcriptional regulator